ncbi:MAG: TIR domain-containing protein [Ilumatobacter sp.]|uniref:TIR domain-containing protein n=1 Tax=Ilumatobacter sp. TaxID=1967498 RepID=UPI00391C8A04
MFIVHGHAEEQLHAAARLINKLTQREPVILREQPNGGRTIIEKFESHASECAFAIVLLTADDRGRSAKVQDEQPRARQNVVFEAGYFAGLLGRGKVVLLHEPGVGLPSDLDGVLYIELSGGWQTNVGIEMRAAGLDIDLNRLSSGD